MKRVIGVRFRTAGKIYYFASGDLEINRGENVIVETARGVEYGTVVGGVKDVPEEKLVQPLKPVIRVATKADEEQQIKNSEKEKQALAVCQEKINAHGLVMKLIDAEYTFDNSKLLFYFTADGRVDFRELVKDLAGAFRTRIELRQIGVRDETKLLGGLGVCGRELCCKTFLADFGQVSIKMAKEQGLSLNQQKISGVCGRLMCCIKNEADTYEELNKNMPSQGDSVTTPEGEHGFVHSVNVLKQKVKVVIENGEDKEIREYPVNEITFKRGHHKDRNLSEEELAEIRELERLEKQDRQEQMENSEQNGSKNDRPEKNFHHKHDSGNGEQRDGQKKFDKKFDKDKKNNNRNGNGGGNKNFNRPNNRDGKPRNDNKNQGDNRNQNQNHNQNQNQSQNQ